MYNHPPERGKPQNEMKTLKLEVGKTYKSREGEEVKIVGKDRTGKFPYTGSDGGWYTERGRFLLYGEISSRDLIEEVEEIPSEPTRHTFDIPDGVKEITVSRVGNCIVVEMVPEEIPEKEKIDKFLEAYADGVVWSREQLRWLIENYLKHREGEK